MYQRVKAHRQRTVGLSSTLRALQRGRLSEVVVADDADVHVLKAVVQACAAVGIPVSHVDSQALLGKACGLSVGASTVGIIE